MSQQPTREELDEANTRHLNWLESQTLNLYGLDVFKIFAYELIQIISNEYLKNKLAESEAK